MIAEDLALVDLSAALFVVIGSVFEDVTSDVVGEIGSWQWMVVFVCTMLMIPPSFFHHEEDLFLLKPPEIDCIPPHVYEVVNMSLCSFRISNGTDVPCNKWHVKLLWMIWLNKSYLVFCDYRARLLSTAMISRFGMVFGCVINGLLADSFGRKNAIFIEVCAATGWRLINIFCDSEGWFRLLVFLKTVFGSAGRYMAVLLVCEVASNRWRSRLMTIVMCPRLVAIITLVPLVDSFPNSETYSFIGCFIGASLVLVIVKWTPESPQWLLFNRKIQVAEKVLLKAATQNGVKFSAEFKIRPVNHRAYNILDEATTCLGVVTTANIRMMVLISFIIWGLYNFLWSSIYIRIFSDSSIPVGWLLLKVMCFFGIFGGLGAFLSESIIKLKHLLMIALVLTGVFDAGEAIFFKFKVKQPLNNLLACLSLACGLVAHALLMLITPRLFAVNIRATLFGFCNATGQLGSIIGYLLSIYLVTGEVAHLCIGLGVTVIIVILCVMYPDVDRRELPDTMEDMDYFSELSKPLRWATQKSRSATREEIELKVYSFGSQSGRSGSNSLTRPPARPVGFSTLWRACTKCFGHN